jgi:hypothetical protein
MELCANVPFADECLRERVVGSSEIDGRAARRPNAGSVHRAGRAGRGRQGVVGGDVGEEPPQAARRTADIR